MKKILVVDDKHSVTALYRKIIEADGRYEVITENLGSRAVETARKCRPDLIILDILMPDMLGSEVAAELRADPALADTKVVFVTAMLKESEEKKANEAAGRYRILAKPISRKDLFAVIDQALGSPLDTPDPDITTFDKH
jgi:CheY-like chemotaxis protein